MRNYELTVVMDGKATPAKKKAFQTKIEKLIETFEGKIGKVEDWGEKTLSYKINKSTSGIFLHLQLELDGESAKGLKIKLEQEDEIIRFLLVRKE